jgi:RNA polymerase sigma factor (sigma-70 family)
VFVGRDADRLWQLFLEQRSQLLAYIRRLTPSGVDSRDVLQEIVLRLLDQPKTAMQRDELTAWCKGVARHIVLHDLRANRYERAKIDALDADSTTEPSWESDKHAAARTTMLGELAQMDQLSRELLFRRYVLEETSQEIARVMNLSAPAVRMRLKRIREATRDKLDSITPLD